MDAHPSKSDLESRLRQTSDAMTDRLDALRDEVSTTGSAVREWIVDHPMASVGGMLATGLAVGLLFGGGSKRRRRNTHQALIDQYVDALSDEVQTAVKKGTDPEKALEKALHDRVPLVVYTAARANPSRTSGAIRSFLGDVMHVLTQTAITLVAREAMETILADTDVDAILADAGVVDAEASGDA